MDITLRNMKNEIRKEMYKKIANLSSINKSKQTEEVNQKLIIHPWYKNANSISIYLGTDSEIRTHNIIKHIFESGKTCFVPRFDSKAHTMEMVKLLSFDHYMTLPLVKFGIRQPNLEENLENAKDKGLDLIIVPGVAFTKDGYRLGHGGGYYDDYLGKFTKYYKTKTIALCFQEQIVDKLPLAIHDYKIDIVLYASQKNNDLTEDY